MTRPSGLDLSDRQNLSDKVLGSAAQALPSGSEIEMFATPLFAYPSRGKPLQGDLVLFLASGMVYVAASKLFGGGKVVWQSPVSDFRGGSTGLHMGGCPNYEFDAQLNGSQVKFVFMTFDAAEQVAARIRAAKEWG